MAWYLENDEGKTVAGPFDSAEDANAYDNSYDDLIAVERKA
jgi:hypothetical protein